MAEIRLDQVVKIYPFAKPKKLFGRKKSLKALEYQRSMPYTTSEGVIALQRTSFTVKEGEFAVLVGPSGCGKTTILRMIAGLEDVTDGQIFFNGKSVENVDTKDRNVAMIFQSYALYPHLSVYDNIAFTLSNRRMPREEIEAKIMQTAETLGITKHLQKRPKELSGGEKQRVAIARALVRDPDVFLMDEPLSNLDPAMRLQLRTEIRRIHDKLQKTFVYVTHDQSEALALGDKLIVMETGIVRQIGTPEQVFSSPANKYTAGFIGTPPMNFFDSVKLDRDGDGKLTAHLDRVTLTLPDNPAADAWIGGKKRVTLGVRPVYLTPAEDGIPAKIVEMVTTGTETQILAAFESREINVVLPTQDVPADWSRGKSVIFKPDPDRIYLFDPKTGATIC